jgi:hypothetical protein
LPFNGGDIGGISKGLAGDELWQSSFNVETAGFGLTQSREERTSGRTGRHGGQVGIGGARAIEEGIPALRLCLSRQCQVLDGESLHAPCLMLQETVHVMSRHLGTFITQHCDEALLRRHWLHRFVMGVERLRR